MITAVGLSKHYGPTVAVDQLSFEVMPGHVTGFLGPNGSGKSTTMRLLLGLDRPNAGTSSFSGTPYHELEHPLREVGALLDAAYVHPSRKARHHLWALAASNGIAKKRVDEVLDLVGLSEVGNRRVKTFSLGMKQRLGIAAALLGDPHTMILDEPGNGLDPEGIRWVRDFLAYLAQQGRTVFVSSHLLSEMALMADQLVVIGQGRLMEEGSVASIVDRYADKFVRVRSPQLDQLVALARSKGAVATLTDDRAAQLRGVPVEAIGELAAANDIVLHELTNESGSLEDAFLNLTGVAQVYRSTAVPGGQQPQPLAAPGTTAPGLHIPGHPDSSPPCFGMPTPSPGAEPGQPSTPPPPPPTGSLPPPPQSQDGGAA